MRFGEGDILQYLASGDAACRACGYSLRGVAAPRCPECGAGLDWSAVEPRPRPPLASRAFAGAQAALFMGAFLAVFLLVFRRSRISAAGPAVAQVLAGYILPTLCILALSAWLRWHARLLRQRPRVQARLLWGAIALVALEAIVAMHAGLI